MILVEVMVSVNGLSGKGTEQTSGSNAANRNRSGGEVRNASYGLKRCFAQPVSLAIERIINVAIALRGPGNRLRWTCG